MCGAKLCTDYHEASAGVWQRLGRPVESSQKPSGGKAPLGSVRLPQKDSFSVGPASCLLKGSRQQPVPGPADASSSLASPAHTAAPSGGHPWLLFWHCSCLCVCRVFSQTAPAMRTSLRYLSHEDSSWMLSASPLPISSRAAFTSSSSQFCSATRPVCSVRAQETGAPLGSQSFLHVSRHTAQLGVLLWAVKEPLCRQLSRAPAPAQNAAQRHLACRACLQAWIRLSPFPVPTQTHQPPPTRRPAWRDSLPHHGQHRAPWGAQRSMAGSFSGRIRRSHSRQIRQGSICTQAA